MQVSLASRHASQISTTATSSNGAPRASSNALALLSVSTLPTMPPTYALSLARPPCATIARALGTITKPPSRGRRPAPAAVSLTRPEPPSGYRTDRTMSHRCDRRRAFLSRSWPRAQRACNTALTLLALLLSLDVLPPRHGPTPFRRAWRSADAAPALPGGPWLAAGRA